ncbi:DUF59 domain-containing protein [[Brevibacterium] frigoritolerans]|uniref:DUF59 domain-containing protein n=1 Tax=Peribacillus frigoritolerans TaxID=450367 RepID=A0A941FIM9_9BACI|nr:DUF59 domain-containing protein [Peribacillus frigoritolerans]
MNLLKDLKDPFLHKNLEETNGIIEIKIKPEKNHVSVKLAIAKTGTAEQMQMQSEVVDLLKTNGAESVGIRFTELSEEELAKHRESIPRVRRTEVCLDLTVRLNSSRSPVVKAEWENLRSQ